jgi:hypothetical protein
MKNLIVFTLFASLVFISCKKDRVCKCTTTTTGTTSTQTKVDLGTPIDTTIVVPLNVTSSNEITFYKVSKRKAKNNCFDKSEDVNETTQNGIPGVLSINVTNAGKKRYSCELK